MIDWLIDHLALIMFVSMFVVIFCGYPVAMRNCCIQRYGLRV